MESDIFDSGKYEKYLATNSKYEVTCNTPVFPT